MGSEQPQGFVDEKIGALFIGGTRYSKPLNAMHRKKFEHLSSIAENYVIAFSQDGRPLRFRECANFYLLPPVPIAPLRYLLFFVVSLFTGLGLCLWGMTNVIVAQSPYEGLAAIMIKYGAWLLGRKIIVVTEIHGDWEESPFLYRRVYLPKVYRFMLQKVADSVLKKSDMIRVISEFTKKKVEGVVSNKPIFVFPTYTDIELFLEGKGHVYASGGEKLVLFVGMLVFLKGVHILIQAMKLVIRRVPDAKLLIIGRGAYKAQLEKLVSELGLEGKMEFLGHVPQEVLRGRMRSCRVLVLPSLSEGLGRVLIEAMACGKPVIGTDTGGIPSLIHDGGNGFLIPPNDPDALAEKLIYLLSNEDEAVRMGARGREFVAQTFSTERYVEGYAKVLDESARLLGLRAG
jgi:glycosyltransferase involved in cell wall biosynthesis